MSLIHKKTLQSILLIRIFQSTRPADIQLDTCKITATLEQMANTYKVPDYSVVIIRHGSILFQQDRRNENKLKNYLIGSCSKSFTALAILKLVNDGKIILDAPVKKYLPWFEMNNPSYSSQVTVRQLLNQTSGFERQYGYYDNQELNLKLSK